MAKRIQLKRTKGWRMPPNTVKVDRSTPWGNPFKPVRTGDYWEIEDITGDSEILTLFATREAAVEASLILYRVYAATFDVTPLRGKDLACWCKPGEPCHADTLLELANNADTIVTCQENSVYTTKNLGNSQ